MPIDIQDGDMNQDGSITIKVDGKSVKFVRESDLGSVKVALEKRESEVTDLQAKLATANDKYNSEHQELLKERASKEELEKSAGEANTLKATVTELQSKLAETEKSSGDLSSKYTERLRSQLATSYKVDPEKIKDKSLADLELMEQTLSLVGPSINPANYDGKGGASGPTPEDLTGKSPMALATMGYEESGKSKKKEE